MYIRKTMALVDLKTMINGQIQRETDFQARRALSILLMNVLTEANAYRGYRYTNGWTGKEDWYHHYY